MMLHSDKPSKSIVTKSNILTFFTRQFYFSAISPQYNVAKRAIKWNLNTTQGKKNPSYHRNSDFLRRKLEVWKMYAFDLRWEKCYWSWSQIFSTVTFQKKKKNRKNFTMWQITKPHFFYLLNFLLISDFHFTSQTKNKKGDYLRNYSYANS